MLWEIEIQPKIDDRECGRVNEEYALLTQPGRPANDTAVSSETPRNGLNVVARSAHGYLLVGSLTEAQVARLTNMLLVDPLVERSRIRLVGTGSATAGGVVTVLLKPGVMDPVALSVQAVAEKLGVPVESVHTFRRYYLGEAQCRRPILFGKVLANEAIEQVCEGDLAHSHMGEPASYTFELIEVPLRNLDDQGLRALSLNGQLSLSLVEMQTIQAHFRTLGREPTDVELETIAQTWSEHCSHKTLKGRIDFEGRHYDNLLRETIFSATQTIRSRLGAADWCVSVFEDNAGVVAFDDRYHVCFKVETHNHPSAIEPYGGANTGLGGVIRDPLGTGLGAKPICNTDVFCFAAPDTRPEQVPPGALHPAKVIRGVVAGVRDYGNRMGIPTVNGAVYFEDRYLANPLVFCGTVGLIPVSRSRKQAHDGDLIVVVGGRTGRDGIHGATFSSVQLTSESEKVSGGAVQIGNAIAEKKVVDVLLQARDLGFYSAITDCGAGGFSSAIGEMAENIGAVVDLDRAPLKYSGLSYTEIWISEAQERMILAVPPDKWPRLDALCRGEDVEATVIGRFANGGRLKLNYEGRQVADIDLGFLHNGRPPLIRKATRPARPAVSLLRTGEVPGSSPRMNPGDTLLGILSSYNVCSKEWIIRQYDHEVQGGTIIKPLVGKDCDGPGDAAVVLPVLGSQAALAVGCGLNPRYGDLDPYRMAAAAIDEAVRNVVAVGADPARIALLDNFCWGNTDRPEQLGALVLAAEACRDVSVALGMPFISGKDSLNNEFHAGDRNIVIPPTLLISALGRVPDARRCVTMDLKEAGNPVFLLGTTRNEMGGSHYNLIHGLDGGEVPAVDPEQAGRIFSRLHEAIENGLVRACHDLSEGGLAVAAAEMAFAGGIGLDLYLARLETAGLDDATLLFSESATRFLVEVPAESAAAFATVMSETGCCVQIGGTGREARLRIAGLSGEWIIWSRLADLKEAWQKPLRW